MVPRRNTKENSAAKEYLLRPRPRRRGGGSPKSCGLSPSSEHAADHSEAASSNANVLSLPTEEEEDPKPSGSSSSENIPKFKLPKYLSRPAFHPIAPESISAIEPSLEKVPVQYILQKLKDVGERMYATTTKVAAENPGDEIPEELEILVNEPTADTPTHIVAISPLVNDSPVNSVALHPVHGIILAAHCANLHVLPHSQPPGGALRVTVPVVTISLPHPGSFGFLLRYLYTRRAQDVLAALFPDGTVKTSPPGQPKKIAETHTVNTILSYIYLTHGLWSNVTTLGIFDETLWRVIEYTWKTLSAALSLKTDENLASGAEYVRLDLSKVITPRD